MMKHVLSFLNIVFIIKLCESITYTEDFVDSIIASSGSNATLSCNLTDLDANAARVLWFKDDASIPFYSRSPSNTYDTNHWGTHVKYEPEEGQLQILNITQTDSGRYHCSVDTDSSPTRKSYSHLQVVVPPERIVVVNKGIKVNDDYVGPYKEGDTLKVKCISIGGSPTPQLTWYSDRKLLDNTSLQISSKRVLNELVLPELKRSDLGTRLTCEASNDVLSETFIKTTVYIDMKLGPQVITLYKSNGASREGTRGWFACRAVGARPPPDIVWFKNRIQFSPTDQNTTLEKDDSIVSSVISVELKREDDNTELTCCASSYKKETDLTCSRPVHLEVQYPPELVLIVNGDELNETAIILGENVTLECNITANPWITDYTWYKDETLIRSGIYEEFTYPVYIASEPGTYHCAATNAEGVGYSKLFTLHVNYAAKCTDEFPPEIGVATNTSVNVTCNTKAEPQPDKFKWFYQNDSEVFEIANTEEAYITYFVEDQDDYGTIVCMAHNSVDNGERCPTIVSSRAPPREPAQCTVHKSKEPPRLNTICPRQNIGKAQKYILSIVSEENEAELWSISGPNSNLSIDEPQNVGPYKLVLTAANEEGNSPPVFFTTDSFIEEDPDRDHVVANVGQLVLWLALAVLGVSACACAIAVCARDHGSGRTHLNSEHDGETCNRSNTSEEDDDDSLRKSASMRRSGTPKSLPKPLDLHRTHSFRTPACLLDERKYNSLRSSGRSDALLCDRFLHHNIQGEQLNYSIPRPPVPYTIPRRMSNKDFVDSMSLSSTLVDNLPLPPPVQQYQTIHRFSKEGIEDSNPFGDRDEGGFDRNEQSSQELSRGNSSFRVAALKISKPNSEFVNRF